MGKPEKNRSDLKPENVVFEGESMESTIKIIDFGRSRLLQIREKMCDKAGSVFFYYYRIKKQ